MQPDQDTPIAWEAHDELLHRLRQQWVRPILGLLHHGYGPRWSGVLHPEFPRHFARYAERVARRYPWVTAYTPINEPLTTARFSGLYGHWYPHARDARVFAKFLVAQCRATVYAMRAIRKINPAAELIQTDDLGKVTGTPTLAYQCDFENERRWLAWDLLAGKVDPAHPMWGYLRGLGITECELWSFVESPCPPDIIGINHYVTSERYLDDQIDEASGWCDAVHVGGNGHHRYADMATTHLPHVQPVGIGALLQEAWERYTLPIAVTECHLGSTREQQLRWLSDTWRAAHHARTQGADVRAVTTWALLGLYDWDSLVTQDRGHYESGAFDVRAPQPRRTAIATMVRALAKDGDYTHPVLATGGWWRGQTHVSSSTERGGASPQPLLIIGASGTLGRALGRMCMQRGISYQLVGRSTLDMCNAASIAAVFEIHRPWAVINAAGYVHVDCAEQETTACWNANVVGPTFLARECARRDIPFVTYSSDMVFDGVASSPYVESDTPRPLNWYGKSKAAAEAAVLAADPDALIIRTSAFFGPWDEYNMVARALSALQQDRPFAVARDVVVTPTYVPDLANATLDLVLDEERGLWHLTNRTAVSWADFIRQAADACGVHLSLLEERDADAMDFIAQRPPNSALGSERGWMLPTLEDALRRFSHERQASDVRSLAVA